MVNVTLHDRRVTAWLPTVVDEPIFRQIFSFVEGNTNFSKSDPACGHVKQNRRLFCRSRHSNADRIGGKPCVRPTERCHQRGMVGNVDKMQGNHSGSNALLTISADAAHVIRIPNRHQDKPFFFAKLQSLLHCFFHH